MGEMAKLANKLVAAATMCAVAKAFALSLKVGPDPKVFFKVITESNRNCCVFQARMPHPGIVPMQPSGRDLALGFTMDLMLKHVTLAVVTADELKVALLTAADARYLY